MRDFAFFSSNAILRGTNTSAIQASSNLTFDGTDILLTSSSSDKPIFTIQNTNNEADSGTLLFINDGNSPANND